MRHIIWGLLAICLLGISACASSAVGSTQSALVVPSETPITLNREARLSDTLVVIRYPSVISDDALPVYASAFAARPIGGSVSNSDLDPADTERLAQSLVSKTNFFVMSLYDSLRRSLPEDSVVLSPHSIELGDENQLISIPLMESEALPTVLFVDFAAYSFPDGEQMMDAPPLTFGDLFSPLISVRTDFRARPGTYGLLMASGPLIGPVYRDTQSAAWRDLAAIAEGATPGSHPDRQQRLAILSYLDPQGSDRTATMPLNYRTSVEAVQVVPIEKLALPKTVMEEMQNTPDQLIDPLATRYTDHAADRIIALLNLVDQDRATFVARMRAIADYDSELADLYLNGTTDPEVAERLRYAELLLQAERNYIVARSNALYFGSVKAERGTVMREILAAEWRALEERRRLAAEQNAATALAVLAVAGAVAASTSDNPNVRNGAGSIAIGGAVVATTSALRARQESRAIGINTPLALATAFEEQISVQLNLITGTEEISAANFGEFHDQLIALYADQIGEISLTAQTCQFGSNGIWRGACENGLATGRGRGIISEDGSPELEAFGAVMIEYYGDAEAGQASGTGLLISAGDVTMTGYEGQFYNGELSGDVTVYRVGERPQSAVYQNGERQPLQTPATTPKLFNETAFTGS